MDDERMMAWFFAALFVSVPIIFTVYLGRQIWRWVAERRRRQGAGAYVGGAESERGVFKPCSNCGVFSFLLPFVDEAGRSYCSELCRDHAIAGRPTFCERCLSETSADQAEGWITEIGSGWDFGRPSLECPSCHSTVRRLWVRLFLLPVFPLAEYRTIQTSPYKFRSRRCRPG